MFLPTDIAGNRLWLDASALTGLNDGDPVTTWPDSSGNAKDATQGTEAAKPLYKTNALNALPVVRFDGIDDVMACTTPAITIKHVFAVAKYNAATFSNYMGLVTGTVSGGAGNGFSLVGLGTGSTSFYNDTGYTTVYHKNGEALAETAMSAPMRNAAVMSISWDGWSYIPMIGQDRGTAGRFWNGDVAEVILYDTVLSESDRWRVENYLKIKYFASLLLVRAHRRTPHGLFYEQHETTESGDHPYVPPPSTTRRFRMVV